MRIRIGWLLLLVVGVIAACSPTASDLPLAEDQPTFLFFYTDG